MKLAETFFRRSNPNPSEFPDFQNLFMNPLKIILALILGLNLAGCSKIFETDMDVQARQALNDLMEIQESFYQKNQRYARNLLEIEKYNLKYHTGIVYLEIESASQDEYRAISLPAESTTARVFAYDSGRGGFYEMGQEEVSEYVLGALNHIRKQQREINIIDFFSGTLVIMLSGLGIITARRQKGKYASAVLWPYFICLFPLSGALAAQNHMNEDIFINPILYGGVIAVFFLAAVCIIWNLSIFAKVQKYSNPDHLLTLIICAVIISLVSGALLMDTYLTYLAS